MTHNIDSLPVEIMLGNQGERSANSVLFDVTAWLNLYPAADFSVTYTRQNETAVYSESAENVSVETLQDEAGVDISILTWTPGAAVLDVAGQGTVVIHCVEDVIEKRSTMTCTRIQAGHSASETPPEPLADYIAKWGTVDATVEAYTETPSVEVTQDANGTHFLFKILPPTE